MYDRRGSFLGGRLPVARRPSDPSPLPLAFNRTTWTVFLTRHPNQRDLKFARRFVTFSPFPFGAGASCSSPSGNPRVSSLWLKFDGEILAVKTDRNFRFFSPLSSVYFLWSQPSLLLSISWIVGPFGVLP